MKTRIIHPSCLTRSMEPGFYSCNINMGVSSQTKVAYANYIYSVSLGQNSFYDRNKLNQDEKYEQFRRTFLSKPPSYHQVKDYNQTATLLKETMVLFVGGEIYGIAE